MRNQPPRRAAPRGPAEDLLSPPPTRAEPAPLTGRRPPVSGERTRQPLWPARAVWWRPAHARRLLIAAAPAVAVVVALLALWQWYASGPGANAFILPTPLAVATSLVTRRDALWANTWVTLRETLLGFAAALGAGVVFGVLVDSSPWLRRALYPLLVITQTIPLITLAPLLVLWFGPELISKVIVVVLICFFPITVALASGLRAADPELLKLYRAFGAGPVRIFWSVRLPGALPALFSGIRIGIAYSVIGAIFGEYVGADAGLGLYMQLNQKSLAVAAVLAAVVVAGALSVALFELVAVVERLALPWSYLA
ncbi:MAG: ABC transporter permease, partial [Ktedonobacterales bacterium]|nr:ABC transporter permease [Ktedonobacterales bacterium]